MAVLSYREVIPRTFTHRFGESPSAEIKYVATLDGATATQDILNAIGIFHGSQHPEYLYLRCLAGNVNETDQFHAEVLYSYGVVNQDSQSWDPSPLARADVWSFSTGGSQVPALVYYDGSTRKPLVNAAGDYFDGITVNEAEVRCSISGNRASFPLAVAAAVTNTVNSAPYLGGAAHTWFCSGISGQQTAEVINDIEIRYWQVSVELVYRQSGHNLQLPHVGWHYVNSPGGPKYRTYVRAADGTDVDAATPQPLTTTGSQKYTGGTSGEPDILERRVYPAVSFSTFFGTPPF